jgi:hypothetical protein
MGEYALQLREKQKAKYTYGVLEKQFRKTFEEAPAAKALPAKTSSSFWKLASIIRCSDGHCAQPTSCPPAGKPQARNRKR